MTPSRPAFRPETPAAPDPAPAAGADPVRLSVNGATRSVPAGTTLDAVVAERAGGPTGVAAAVNEAVVPRGQWPTHRLADGDRVEILSAVQGG